MATKKELTEDELIRILQASSILSSQKNVAANLGVSRSYLSSILRKRWPISEGFAKRMGYKMRITFEEIAK